MNRLWSNIGRTMAEYSIMDRLWHAGRIEVEGLAHVHAARATGRPGIGVCLHLGNWELIGPVVIYSGYPAAAMYLRPDNPFEHRIVMSVRKRYGMQLVEPTLGGMREAVRLLQQNNIFGIYVDEFIRNRVHAPAFGRKLQASGNIAYAARLAALTDAVVVPVYCTRIGEAARFKVTFLPPIELVKMGDRDADLTENVRRIDTVIDPIIKAHLDQWYYVLDLELDEAAA
jgi:Kdo2-lipid IVA lauroyltransferase/acyltransferase